MPTKLRSFWIRFWYNDVTRILCMLGVPLIPLLILLSFLHPWISGEVMRGIVELAYIVLIGWMMVDNDYSNLRLVGLDEYRKPLILAKF